MAGAAQTTRRTRAVGVATSLVLHLAVLSWLGLRAVQPLRAAPPEEPPPLTVELVRPPPLAARAPASPRPRASAPAAVEPVVVARPRPPAPVPRTLTPKALPLPPVRSGATANGQPAATASGGGAIGARPAPGPLPGVEMRSDLTGFLRSTVGCSHEEYLRLTPAERARCDSGFATAYRNTPPIPLPDDKLAAFARQADANARKRARREGSLEQPLDHCEIGSAAADKGLGCLPAGAIHTVGKF